MKKKNSPNRITLRKQMAERVKELAERLNLSNVEIVTNTSQLTGKKKRAKGFFNVKTGYIFIKTFNRNGEKIKFYASIIVKKDGMEVAISSHYMNRNAVEKRLKEDNVLYIKDSLLSNSSDMHLAENQNGLPDLLPTQESNESI